MIFLPILYSFTWGIPREPLEIAWKVKKGDLIFFVRTEHLQTESERLKVHLGSSWQMTAHPKSVPESLGMPVTGSPSMLKGYHNSLIDGSPSINTPPLRRALHDGAN